MDDGYNSDHQDDLEIPDGEERVAGHHNGTSTATYRPLVQLTEVALNLPVEAPSPIEPQVISPISEVHTEVDPDPIFSEPQSSPTPKAWAPRLTPSQSCLHAKGVCPFNTDITGDPSGATVDVSPPWKR